MHTISFSKYILNSYVKVQKQSKQCPDLSEHQILQTMYKQYINKELSKFRFTQLIVLILKHS